MFMHGTSSRTVESLWLSVRMAIATQLPSPTSSLTTSTCRYRTPNLMLEYFPYFPHSAVARLVSLLRSPFAISTRCSRLLHPTLASPSLSQELLSRNPSNLSFVFFRSVFFCFFFFFFHPSLSYTISRQRTWANGNGGARGQVRSDGPRVGQESKSKK